MTEQVLCRDSQEIVMSLIVNDIEIIANLSKICMDLSTMNMLTRLLKKMNSQNFAVSSFSL